MNPEAGLRAAIDELETWPDWVLKNSGFDKHLESAKASLGITPTKRYTLEFSEEDLQDITQKARDYGITVESWLADMLLRFLRVKPTVKAVKKRTR